MSIRRISLTFAGLLIMAIASRAISAAEITVLEMNVEFYFDHQPPHGRVVGADGGVPIPTESEWKEKAQLIAEKISEVGADIVALIEVENEAVVEEIRSRLIDPQQWYIIFEEGRDSYTGQDVALLSKYPADIATITNYPGEREVFYVGGEERSVSPSKILGASFVIEGQQVYIIASHLISRRGDNDEKRLAQATLVRRQAVLAMLRGENVIIVGDMNDTPRTRVLQRLRGLDDIWGDFVQTANEVAADDRYTYVFSGEVTAQPLRFEGFSWALGLAHFFWLRAVGGYESTYR